MAKTLAQRIVEGDADAVRAVTLWRADFVTQNASVVSTPVIRQVRNSFWKRLFGGEEYVDQQTVESKIKWYDVARIPVFGILDEDTRAVEVTVPDTAGMATLVRLYADDQIIFEYPAPDEGFAIGKVLSWSMYGE